MVKLMLGDCLERMREIGAGTVDLIACDLPYGTTSCRWDAVVPFEPLWSAFKRVLKSRGAVVLTASQPFTSALVTSNIGWFKYCWVWEKTLLGDFLNAAIKPLKSHEDIAVFSPGTTANRSSNRMVYNPQPFTGNPYRVVNRTDKRCGALAAGNRTPFEIGRIDESDGTGQKPRSILRFKSERGLHPTQKPVALFEYLIRTYSNEDDTVLDCCMGSGTTGVACVNTGRDFIGIERDPAYFATAESRIAAARASTPLLTPAPA